MTLDLRFAKSAPNGLDALILCVYEGKKLSKVAAAFDAEFDGALTRALKHDKFSGKAGETLVIPGIDGAETGLTILAGLGKDDAVDANAAERLGSNLTGLLNAQRVRKAAVIADFAGDDADKAARIAMGLRLASYRFDKYLTKTPDDKKPTLKAVTIVSDAASKAQAAFKDLDAVASGVTFTRDLVSEAPNVLYPESFAKLVEKELKPLGVKVTILTVAQMEKLGMGSLLAVGQGSARDARLVIMEYNGAGAGSKKNKRPFAFVGKGITFDTGGISLKPGPGMEDMKWDMAGAGCVAGLMKALAGRKAKVNAIGVLALAENMPSGTATRPGDIVTSMSGQTIEILNTDAEGRLVLADALWYVQEKYKPRGIIDLATLTGAIIIALGHEYAGAFGNDDALAADIIESGKNVGELVWQMPMNDAWNKAMDSPAADMKNISGGRDAGSATAAAFLSRFIQKDVPWVHLDIAGVAWSTKDRTSVPKGAAGWGVRLLNDMTARKLEG